MQSLHFDITYKILSHVPSESVLNCKLVCKTWRSLLSHFKVKAGLLLAISHEEMNDQENSVQIYYGYYDDILKSDQGDRFTYTTLPKILHHPIKMWKYPPVMVGSCNGLVCISLPQPHNDPRNDPVYICNPLTGEYVNLPKLSAEIGRIGSGFGYLPKTNEYKVVRIHYPPVESTGGFGNKTTCGLVQVYTLGGGDGARGWRDVGETTDVLCCLPGVTGDGVIHFMDTSKWKLVTFDLADEEFHDLPQPLCLGFASRRGFYEVKVLRGRLYVVHQESGKHVDLWSFNQRDMNWSQEFRIPWESPNSHIDYQPFSLTRSNQVLFSLSGNDKFHLCCYDPENNSVETIASEDKKFRSFETILHMNSLVSLKDLGVQSNQI